MDDDIVFGLGCLNTAKSAFTETTLFANHRQQEVSLLCRKQRDRCFSFAIRINDFPGQLKVDRVKQILDTLVICGPILLEVILGDVDRWLPRRANEELDTVVLQSLNDLARTRGLGCLVAHR